MNRTSVVGQWTVRSGVAVACGLLMAACVAQAQQPATAAPPPGTPTRMGAVALSKPAANKEESSVPDKPGAQGVKVHGHWVIDLRNPDGTLAKHLDFENSLTTGGGAGTDYGMTGDQLVAALLSGTGVASAPGIGFIQAPAPGSSLTAGVDISSLCNPSVAAMYVCGILTTAQSPQSDFQGYAASVQNGLTSTANFSGTVNWVLTGSFTVPSSMTEITAVQTLMSLCYTDSAINNELRGLKGSVSTVTATNAPTACTLANINASAGTPNAGVFTSFGSFTSTVLPNAPLLVTTGQVLTVSVTISFS